MLMILYGVAVALILVTIALALGTAWMKKKVNRARREEEPEEQEVPFLLEINTGRIQVFNVEHRIGKEEYYSPRNMEAQVRSCLAEQLAELLLAEGAVRLTQTDDIVADIVRIRASLVAVMPEDAND